MKLKSKSEVMGLGMERGEGRGKVERVKTDGGNIDGESSIRKGRGWPRREESKTKDGPLEKFITRKSEISLSRTAKSKSSDISGRDISLRRRNDANNSFVKNTATERHKIENVHSNEMMEANTDEGAESRRRKW